MAAGKLDMARAAEHAQALKSTLDVTCRLRRLVSHQPRRPPAARIDQIEADLRRFGLALGCGWRADRAGLGWAAPGMWRARCPARCCICATICTPGAGYGDPDRAGCRRAGVETGAPRTRSISLLPTCTPAPASWSSISARWIRWWPAWMAARRARNSITAQRQALGATVGRRARDGGPIGAGGWRRSRPPPAPRSRRAATSPIATRAWTTPSAQCQLADGVSQAAQRITELRPPPARIGEISARCHRRYCRPDQSAGAERRHRSRPRWRGRARALPWWPTRGAQAVAKPPSKSAIEVNTLASDIREAACNIAAAGMSANLTHSETGARSLMVRIRRCRRWLSMGAMAGRSDIASEMPASAIAPPRWTPGNWPSLSARRRRPTTNTLCQLGDATRQVRDITATLHAQATFASFVNLFILLPAQAACSLARF